MRRGIDRHRVSVRSDDVPRDLADARIVDAEDHERPVLGRDVELPRRWVIGQYIRAFADVKGGRSLHRGQVEDDELRIALAGHEGKAPRGVDRETMWLPTAGDFVAVEQLIG